MELLDPSERGEPADLDVAAPRVPMPRLLLLAVVVEAMAYGAIFALLAELQDRYDLPTWGLGIITAAAFVASLLAQVSLARYADRGYTRLLLRLGLAMAAAGLLWFAVATELWQFTAARALLGLGSGVFVPAVRRVIVSADPGRAGERLGRLAAVEVAGFVAGPPVAAVLAGVGGLRTPFLVQAGALALCAPALARLAEPPVQHEPERRAIRVLLAKPGVLAGLAAGAGTYLSVGVFDAIWARFLTDQGASTTMIGATLALFALPLVVLSPAGGRAADRLGSLRVAVVALALTTPLLALYGVFDSLVALCIVAFLHSTADAYSSPGGQATVARAAGPDLLAAGQGLYGALGAASAGFGALAAAPIYGAAGAGAMWAAAAAAVGLLTVLAAAWGRRAPELARPAPPARLP